ncbi:hypothetical protein Pan258_46440 [Symmachiella dynata]|nr:hypothetical protein Pan258_46440 [Symmachiella dynata]
MQPQMAGRENDGLRRTFRDIVSLALMKSSCSIGKKSMPSIPNLDKVSS